MFTTSSKHQINPINSQSSFSNSSMDIDLDWCICGRRTATGALYCSTECLRMELNQCSIHDKAHPSHFDPPSISRLKTIATNKSISRMSDFSPSHSHQKVLHEAHLRSSFNYSIHPLLSTTQSQSKNSSDPKFFIGVEVTAN